MTPSTSLVVWSQRGVGLPAIALLYACVATACVPGTVAADAGPPRRVLVDFENPQAVTLHASGAEGRIVPRGAGHALEVRTETGPSYPSAQIVPRAGRWDLTGFDAVEIDVTNPQDVPVRVLLSVANPGSDGRKGCNTDSVSVPAKGQATLVLPLGTWHGEPNHPIDLANVVSAHVLLDKPGRAHHFLVDNLRAVRFTSALAELAGEPFFKQLAPAFGRGVNLGNALEAPREGAWGVTLKEEYFARIKSAGFDTVRVPIRWSAHAAAAPPYAIDPGFFQRVDWAVKQCLARGLTPVINMHHYDELDRQPDAHAPRFVALWRQIAEHYQDQPRQVAFELLNEPHDKLDAARWNKLLAETLAVVRRTNPTRTVVVGPVGWNAIKDLPALELPEADRNLVVTVHYYSPFQFTHQGASWAGPAARSWLGTKWTGSKAERQAVERDLDCAIVWAVKHRRPIWLGEFGAYEKADLESRARWTRFVAQEALKRHIGFAYWEFCAGFGVYDPKRDRWIEPLRQALLK